jgi:pimeloyl-ACP methyl ester carboxylesterase
LLYYQLGGTVESKKALVFIHGFALNGSMFQDLVDKLKDTDRCFIIPDLRGCGKSKYITGSFTIQECVSDIKEILDQFQFEEVVLLGYSQGGTVAQLFCRQYAHMISGLILCNSFSHNTITFREKLEARIMKRIINVFSLRVIASLIVNELGKNLDFPITKIDKIRTMVIDNNKMALKKYMDEIRKFDSRLWLSEIESHTLIIHGQNDKAVPEHHAHILSEGIKESKMKTIENAGHEMIWTHAEKLAEVIMQYCYMEDRIDGEK